LADLSIAIDAMGGDNGLKATVPAVIKVLKKHPDINFILVGQEKVLRRVLGKYKLDKHPRLSVQHASEVVAMDESPALALRNKKDSSMRVAINLVKDGKAQACVSAGNTGALMATARFVLKMLPGIDRPAIVYAMPTVDQTTGERGSVNMLDLGANVGCTSEHLFQFAVMGSVLSEARQNIKNPKVALLNIGEEDIKGPDSIKHAAKMLADTDGINYTGFVEGNDIFKAKADVIVCDGFIGNVALKSVEGLASFINYNIKSAFKSNLLTKLCGILAFPVLLKIKKNLDMRRFNGASFLGIKGVVIKSHGGADSEAFVSALEVAVVEASKDLPGRLHNKVESLMGQLDAEG